MATGEERRRASVEEHPAVSGAAGRQARFRDRVERERLIVRLRGFAVVFSVVQSLVKPGDSTVVTWLLVAILTVDWAVTSRLLRSEVARVGAVGMALDTVVCGLVLANNRHDPADPIFLVVLFLALEAALRWGRTGGVIGGLGAGALSGVWAWAVIWQQGQGTVEHVTLRFGTILIVGAVTGGLVRRLDLERARLAELAYTDALTGLANRPALQEELAAALARDAAVALVFLDLDGFKAVNDRLGHTSGDAALAAIAARLRSTVRDGDVVARLGGDEFVVVVQGEHTRAVDELAGRLREAVVEPLVIAGQQVTVGVSCGAVMAHPADDVDSLLRRADDAMYRAKRGARPS